MDTNAPRDADDPSLSPSGNTTPPVQQSSPDAILNTKFKVSEEMVSAGRNTDLPRDTDSPESLDEEIAKGANRENIDPHHSTTYNRSADDSTDFVEDN